MKSGFRFLLALMLLWSLHTPGWALNQTDMKILGVSTNLEKLGVVETWIADGSGFPMCEVRLYNREQWEPEKVMRLDPDDNMSDEEFGRYCDILQKRLVKQADLHEISWDKVELSPRPYGIKDKNGYLKTGFDSENPYPPYQIYNFTLPTNDSWQLVVRSRLQPGDFTRLMEDPEAFDQEKLGFNIVLRPKQEPLPYDAVRSTYRDGQVLMMPVTVMVNNHYGLVMVLIREYRLGFEGFDYHYRPYFTRWPDYQPMSVEEAKALLKRSPEFAMELNELEKGPNTMHPGYRAFLRLKTENLPVGDIMSSLHQSSTAGKLYWLDLLYRRDPHLYVRAAQEILSETPETTEVIQITGRQWQPHPFNEMLRQQARLFRVKL